MADTKAMAAAYEAALKSGDIGELTKLSHEYGSPDLVQISKMTECFANPFPAPEWRAPFVEKM